MITHKSKKEKERYQVTLNTKIVTKVLEIQKTLVGSSNLSSLIDKLLKDWLSGALALEPLLNSLNEIEPKPFLSDIPKKLNKSTLQNEA